eukprot:1313036-Rhodomonas_salina.2
MLKSAYLKSDSENARGSYVNRRASRAAKSRAVTRISGYHHDARQGLACSGLEVECQMQSHVPALTVASHVQKKSAGSCVCVCVLVCVYGVRRPAKSKTGNRIPHTNALERALLAFDFAPSTALLPSMSSSSSSSSSSPVSYTHLRAHETEADL